MKPSLRFLALVVVGWAAVRASSFGLLPAADAFTLRPSRAAPPAASGATAILPTEFPELAPPAAAAAPPFAMGSAMPGLGQVPMMLVPASFFAQPPRITVARAPAPPAWAAWSQPPAAPPPLPARPQPWLAAASAADAEPVFYSRIPTLDEWPLSRLAGSAPAYRSAAAFPQQSAAVGERARLDRIQLTTWALIRGRQGVFTAPESLATGGTLGGSQAGARLTYNVSRALGASLRFTSDGQSRGGEAAAGIRYTPFARIPLSLTAERRQAIGRMGGGRNAFALFVEGGLYGQAMPLDFTLDAYAQAGIVGARSRDRFVDGGLTLTRPLFGRFSAGVGVWGGAQPGVYRVDAGPRLSMQLRRNMRIHLDWRQRLAGKAEPGSGPAVTLAADF